MINRDGKLDLLENFQVDPTLPKYANKKKSEIPRVMRQWADAQMARFGNDSDEDSDEDSFKSDDFEPKISGFTGNIIVSGKNRQKPKRNMFLAFIFTPIYYFINRNKRKNLEKIEQQKISIQEFFTSIENSTQEIEIITERLNGYEKAIISASKTGQIALKEQLLNGLEVHRCETQLFATDNKKYLSEEIIVKFVKQAKKGLRLDWVKNFTRIIPQSIIDKKERLDELFVFDNYAILHYDLNKKSWAETEQEVQARRDPILFGLIHGSRKLYFVGDWTDELCDLTLEQIAEALGQEVIQNIG